MQSSRLLQHITCKNFISACAYANGRYPTPYVHPNPLNQPIPTRSKFSRKHWDPKWRKERALKVQKIHLPNFHEKKVDELTPSELKEMTKKLGIQPTRPWEERPVHISCVSSIIDAYIPPEGDDKVALMSKEGARAAMTRIGKKGSTLTTLKKIKNFEDFTFRAFAEQALDIYIKLHKALAEENEDDLHDSATEKAFPLITHETKNKTIRWSFIRSLEPPRVVHARSTEVFTSGNLFAQVTVRLHTQQTLAVYDRFGRLIHGSEVLAKDVLEYVVFEKQISNAYGLWRVHHKIIPDWMGVHPVSHLTYKLEAETADEGSNETDLSTETKETVSQKVD